MANPEAPKPQAPMEARPTSPSGTDASRGVTGPITKAPVSPHASTVGKPDPRWTATNALCRPQKAEPRPVAREQEAELRGGGMTIGFNCCRGHCNCHETCC